MNYILKPTNTEKQAGDILLCMVSNIGATSYINGNIYIAKTVNDSNVQTVVDSKGSKSNGFASKNFRIIKSLPGKSAIKGDTVISIGAELEKGVETLKIGDIKTCHRNSENYMYWSSKMLDYNNGKVSWRVLLKYDNSNNNPAKPWGL